MSKYLVSVAATGIFLFRNTELDAFAICGVGGVGGSEICVSVSFSSSSSAINEGSSFSPVTEVILTLSFM